MAHEWHRKTRRQKITGPNGTYRYKAYTYTCGRCGIFFITDKSDISKFDEDKIRQMVGRTFHNHSSKVVNREITAKQTYCYQAWKCLTDIEWMIKDIIE